MDPSLSPSVWTTALPPKLLPTIVLFLKNTKIKGVGIRKPVNYCSLPPLSNPQVIFLTFFFEKLKLPLYLCRKFWKQILVEQTNRPMFQDTKSKYKHQFWVCCINNNLKIIFFKYQLHIIKNLKIFQKKFMIGDLSFSCFCKHLLLLLITPLEELAQALP